MEKHGMVRGDDDNGDDNENDGVRERASKSQTQGTIFNYFNNQSYLEEMEQNLGGHKTLEKVGGRMRKTTRRATTVPESKIELIGTTPTDFVDDWEVPTKSNPII